MKTSRISLLLWSGVCLLAFSLGAAAQTPPMGWNSWNHFGLNHHPPTDAMIRAQAKAMVDTGMKDAGYTYVNIDDEWQGGRDAQGNIFPNKKQFPDGMGPVADYVHGLGLKIGIYSSPGAKTCAKRVGSLGHEAQDANTFAAWGMDYLKYDWCSATGDKQTTFYKMYQALQDTGRPFVYSIVDYGEQKVWKWAPAAGANLWRTGPDVHDDYYNMAETGFDNNGLEKYSGPTVGINNAPGWNDPDMLQVGNGGMTISQYRMQMSLWSILAAPLIAGNDLTLLPNQQDGNQKLYLAILTNPDIIAVDQDPLGQQGRRVWQEGPQEIWAKAMSDGSIVVGVFNRVQGNVTVALPFGQIGVKGTVDAFNLWAGKDLGNIQSGYPVPVAGEDATMLRLTPVK